MNKLIDKSFVELNGVNAGAIIGARKVYNTPCLRAYGAVEVVTQGSKSSKWDGSATKKQ